MSPQNTPRILVPTGFSDQSLKAFEQAVNFARVMKAKIILLSVIERDGMFARIFEDKELTKKIMDKAKKQLQKLAETKSKETGVEIETTVSEGVVYEEIAKAAEMFDVDMVVMGTNGKPSNIRKRMIGSNAYRVVTLCEPPVVTIKGDAEISQIKNLVFPIVADRKSREKTGMALRVARLFNAHIHAVAFITKESDRKMLTAQLRQIEKFIREKGVSVSSEVVEPENRKPIAKLTIEYAHRINGDMILITEEGEEPDLADMLLGSDVRDMLYYSDIPVMSVTPSPEKFRSVFEG
ncbi:MAG: universal stress protein [Cryomorphaceae bacterium]|nr:universal stress protein [Cryomorphaceae bacterium]